MLKTTKRWGFAGATLLLCALVITPGCGAKLKTYPHKVAPTCMATVAWGPSPGDTIRWVRTDKPRVQPELDAWCGAVGPPLMRAQPDEFNDVALDSLAILVWNIYGGSGDALAAIDSLKAGVYSNGVPVEHFVVMLQETHHVGEPIPPVMPAATRSAAAVGKEGPSRHRIDVRDIADASGLAYFYVPSMRNGAVGPYGEQEDRGNAILSTLPLFDPVAIELPLERQRRVAQSARCEVTVVGGERVVITFVNVHLDSRSNVGRGLRSFGLGRYHQTLAMMGAVARDTPLVIGGDFNSWGMAEPCINYMRRTFPTPEIHPSQGTVEGRLILPERGVDHLFFELRQGWDGDYDVIDTWQGSDHHPLVGWIYFSGRRLPD